MPKVWRRWGNAGAHRLPVRRSEGWRTKRVGESGEIAPEDHMHLIKGIKKAFIGCQILICSRLYLIFFVLFNSLLACRGYIWYKPGHMDQISINLVSLIRHRNMHTGYPDFDCHIWWYTTTYQDPNKDTEMHSCREPKSQNLHHS